jgi:hypothetical protein
MVAAINPIVGPHRRAVAAGGWIRMASVRTAKTSALGIAEFCGLAEPGATGAALLAEYSLSGQGLSLTQFVRGLPSPAVPGSGGTFVTRESEESS